MSELTDARDEVVSRVQADVEPVLTYGSGDTLNLAKDIDLILSRYLRYSVRANSTAYSYGDRARPSIRNGRIYEAIQGGTSAASVPTFPEYDGGEVTDGTVIWREVGFDSKNAYDIRSAIRAAWELKLAKASEYLKTSGADESEIYRHCAEQVRRYAPVGVA